MRRRLGSGTLLQFVCIWLVLLRGAPARLPPGSLAPPASPCLACLTLSCKPCSISAQPELKPLRVALAAFLRRSVGPWLAAKQPGAGGLSAEQLGELLRRLRSAERALASSAA